MPTEDRWILELAHELEHMGRYGELRRYTQHGEVSVYDHCLRVAHRALALSRRLRVRVDARWRRKCGILPPRGSRWKTRGGTMR